MTEQYRLPPRLTDASGQPRRAGFEFEFGNLPIGKTAEALQQALGGELDIISPFEAVLHDCSMGRLKIERDANLLKSVRYRGWLRSLGVEFSPGTFAHDIETNIDNASRVLIRRAVASRNTGSVIEATSGPNCRAAEAFSAGLCRAPACVRRSSAWSKKPGAFPTSSRNTLAPFSRIRESGSAPSGSEATRTSRPHSRRAGSDRPIACNPA